MSLILDACVAQHQGDRREQQDRVALVPHPRQPQVALAVLADGMGGHTGGALAAEQVIVTATNDLQAYAPREESPESLLAEIIRESHLLIRTGRLLNEQDPHSTVVLLLLQGRQATWAYCGDSRLYHFRGDQLLCRSRDHSYVQHLVDQGRITPAQALTHPNRNVLLTSLGDREEPRVDWGHGEVQPGDSFLLCSDGLWAYFSEEELGYTLATASAREGAAILIDLARQRCRGKGDNCSLAVLRLGEGKA